MAEKPFPYGGQAVLEGVMIRGRRNAAIAVRRPSGDISVISKALSPWYNGSLRRIPFVRGVIVLAETIVLGTQALAHSANVQLEEQGQELSSRSLAVLITISLTIGVGLFFIVPLLLTTRLDRFFASDVLSNFVEGVIRLGIFLGYLVVISLMPDIRRVFAYHGAEHMTIHAYEHNVPLEPERIRRYSTAHPRCGTAFLLVVMVVAILVFSLTGRPSLPVRILSRIVLIPVIAGISYEIIRFSGMHAANRLVRLILYPSLALQALTTRQPDDSQIEVAVRALQHAVTSDAEEGHEGDVVTEAAVADEGGGSDPPAREPEEAGL